MLTITVPAVDFFDDVNQVFVKTEETTIELEHSLASLSKWESIWEKPFLSPEPKPAKETMDYVKVMTLTPNVPPEVYSQLSSENLKQINDYIDAKMSATWFSEKEAPSRSREIITSELIYHWMITLNIPFECENMHLNRLFTLIKVCNQKNAPEKKMSKQALAARNRELNAQRKAQLGTNG